MTGTFYACAPPESQAPGIPIEPSIRSAEALALSGECGLRSGGTQGKLVPTVLTSLLGRIDGEVGEYSPQALVFLPLVPACVWTLLTPHLVGEEH